ncbi:hypothetical protein GOV11_04505 [Candidatus Woesearchaeota archaeon]|nr:hypothetical protein [Candidatus Woesearchaeota archaeon]
MESERLVRYKGYHIPIMSRRPELYDKARDILNGLFRTSPGVIENYKNSYEGFTGHYSQAKVCANYTDDGLVQLFHSPGISTIEIVTSKKGIVGPALVMAKGMGLAMRFGGRSLGLAINDALSGIYIYEKDEHQIKDRVNFELLAKHRADLWLAEHRVKGVTRLTPAALQAGQTRQHPQPYGTQLPPSA